MHCILHMHMHAVFASTRITNPVTLLQQRTCGHTCALRVRQASGMLPTGDDFFSLLTFLFIHPWPALPLHSGDVKAVFFDQPLLLPLLLTLVMSKLRYFFDHRCSCCCCSAHYSAASGARAHALPRGMCLKGVRILAAAVISVSALSDVVLEASRARA